MYYITMPTISRRVIAGHTYYYAVRSKRVNGKPRLVWQKYLGTADDIIRMREEATKLPTPKADRVIRFGAEAAQLHIAEQIGIISIVDRFLPKRKQGLSVGEYTLIAAINRGCCPKSKRSLAKWFLKSTLSYHLSHVKASDLASQRFWDHMDMFEADTILNIEEAIAKRVIELYDVDIRTLLYDTTNFFTYIDTFNRRCKIALRGHNKQKRFDLRQVSLALLVTKDYHIPLFHRCYEGNRVDSESFQSIVDEVVDRLNMLAKRCTEVTIVFDKGNNSEIAIRKLDSSQYHFIGSLVPSYFLDLLKVSKDKYHELKDERFKGMCAYREERKVFGINRTVVVVFSESFFVKQLKTVLAMAERAERELTKLKEHLKLWEQKVYTRGRAPTQASVKKKVKKILKGQYMEQIFKTEVTTQGEATVPGLCFRFDKERFDELTGTILGKTILFTDNSEWDTEEIIGAYWDKAEVEEAFRRMKDRYYSSWFPMFHWTDKKIRVHAFHCVLALLFTSLLYREANRSGIEISQVELMEKLKEIYQVVHIYASPGKGRKAPEPQIVLSEMDKTQQKLYKLFELKKYE